MGTKIYDREDRYIDLHEDHIHFWLLNDKGRKKIGNMSYFYFKRIIVAITVITIVEILVIAQLIDSFNRNVNVITFSIVMISITIIVIFYYRKYGIRIGAIKSDPNNIELDYYLCFTSNHERHNDIDCINKNDPIVEIGMFYPKKKYIQQQEYQSFENFTWEGFDPQYLREAEADDNLKPTGVSLTIGISETRKLYPFGFFDEHFYGFSIHFESYNLVRDHFSLKLNKYDYVLDLGYIACLVYNDLSLGGSSRGIIIRKKNSEYKIYRLYKRWYHFKIEKYPSYVEKVSRYVDKMNYYYGKEK